MGIKVIFIDIDGCFNSRVFFEKRHKSRLAKSKRLYNKVKYILRGFKNTTLSEHKTTKDYYTYKYQFKRLVENTCSEKWEWLSEFCNENDYKICISSVWRNHFGTKEKTEPVWWDKALKDLGFKEGIFKGVTGERESCRGEEIQKWLDNRNDVENYAIIDDDSDMLDHQFDHFFHCDGWFGLTPNHLYRIKRHFDNKSNYRNLTKTL